MWGLAIIYSSLPFCSRDNDYARPPKKAHYQTRIDIDDNTSNIYNETGNKAVMPEDNVNFNSLSNVLVEFDVAKPG